jgi:hypothetical protein
MPALGAGRGVRLGCPARESRVLAPEGYAAETARAARSAARPSPTTVDALAKLPSVGLLMAGDAGTGDG